MFPRNGDREQQLVLYWFTFIYLHVQTLTLADVQTPFLGTPLAPLEIGRGSVGRQSARAGSPEWADVDGHAARPHPQ